MKYGFVGCGNMGGAIAGVVAKSTADLLLSDRSGKAQLLAKKLGCCYGTIAEAAACQRVFLAVKPQQMEEVLLQLQPVFKAHKPVLITMAAGLKLEQISQMAGIDLPVIRIMPNTPVAVGMGVIQYCANAQVDPEMLADFLQDMRFAGLLDSIDEDMMDAACAVSGCGPAFAYMFIEALAQGGAACGVPAEKALQYAVATVAGAAEMVRATGLSPEELRSNVCSVGGSTIEGVKVLQQQDFCGIMQKCVAASYNRNKELGRR